MKIRATSDAKATIAVLGVGLLSWKELLARLYLQRLKRDGSYFSRIIEYPEGSAERKAVRLYLQTPSGRTALFRAYFEQTVVVAEKEHCPVTPMRADRALLRMSERFLALEWPPVNGVVTGGLAAELEDTGRSLRRAILELVPSILGERFRMPESSEVEFQILERHGALEVFHGRPFPNPEGLEKFMCLVWKVGTPAPEPSR